jgi:SAM-dependent methyltransferase
MPQTMQAEPLQAVRCVLCGDDAFAVICAGAEVQAQSAYVQRFHRRRLRPSRDGAPSRDALVDRADFTQEYTPDIVSCTRCGLVARNPRPSDQAIANAYSYDHYGQERLAALFESQSALYRPKAKFLRRWLPKGPQVRVVEVGSFVGGFLAAGQSYGWTMIGADPGTEVNLFCRSQGLPVFRGTLAELPWQNKTADCIAIWNTFDQLPDPEPTLSSACRLLRPGGLLVVRVPNGACFRLAARLLRRLPAPLAGGLRAGLAWNNLLGFPYLHGYSVQTLDWLLARYGFRRIAVYADTLPRLSDAQTKRWAVEEERVVKGCWKLLAQLEAAAPASRLQTAPWFDAYYQQVLQCELVRFRPPVTYSPSLQPSVA